MAELAHFRLDLFDVLQIQPDEFAVFNAVAPGVFARIVHGTFHHFHAEHLLAVARCKERDGAPLFSPSFGPRPLEIEFPLLSFAF